MMQIRGFRKFGIALGAAIAAAPALAQPADEVERYTDLIHSDLPLFNGGGYEMWPQSFSDPESGEFGCASRIAFGDWILRSTGESDDEDADWYRISNYGLYHCFALVREAGDRQGLQDAEVRPSFFVNLGMLGAVELWAAQIGTRPGSDFLLLSRQPAPGAISEFTVLQRQCPKRDVRDAGNISILITRYCAINTMSELRSLARRMAKLEPLGTLTFVEASE